MPRPRLRQKLPVYLATLFMLFFSTGVAMFGQLVADYGIQSVVTEPTYPIKTNPRVVLSNGAIWSRTKCFVNFLIGCALWISSSLLVCPRILKWSGLSESDLR
jgi:hypothetical protein